MICGFLRSDISSFLFFTCNLQAGGIATYSCYISSNDMSVKLSVAFVSVAVSSAFLKSF